MIRRAPAVLALLSGLALGAPASAAAPRERLEAALVDAVRARMGADAQVIVERVEIFTAPGADAANAADLEALPDPAAMLGRPIGFTLLSSIGDGRGARVAVVGRATATLHVRVPHAVAARIISRGDLLDAGAVDASDDEVTGVPMRRLPSAADLDRARATENLAAGELVRPSAVRTIPAVRSGDFVRATADVGRVLVTATLVAAENGNRGDVIRVVNRDSRRELRARIVANGTVEVVHD